MSKLDSRQDNSAATISESLNQLVVEKFWKTLAADYLEGNYYAKRY